MDAMSIDGVDTNGLSKVLYQNDIPVFVFTPLKQHDLAAARVNNLSILLRPECDIELVRIVDQILGSAGTESGDRMRAFGMELDLLTYTVKIIDSGETHALPPKEARLLRLLLSNPGECISRDFIAQAIWNGVKVGPRTIDSHVSRLRKRLEFTGVEISSKYGDGYTLGCRRR